MLIAALVAAGAIQLVGLAAPSGATVAGVPTCSASAPGPGADPAPACVHRPFAGVGAAQIIGSGKLIAVTKVGNGHVYGFTVLVTYKNPDKVCSSSTTIPVSELPCQQPGVNIRMVGRYIPGSKTLHSGVYDVYPPSPPVTCKDDGPSCTLHFLISAATSYGQVVFVMSYGVVDATANPQGGLSGAGFQFSVAMTIPRFKI